MSEPDTNIKSLIAAHLADLGFKVTLLEETEGMKTPDLLASREAERFLIEVKSKRDDEEEFARQRARSSAGEVGEWFEPWSPRNTVSRIIREGVQQLAAFSTENYDYALLWLHAQGQYPESQFQQFAHTLFGLTNVFSLRDPEFEHECYYFHESAFFSMRGTLDAAIISTATSAQLCLNTYSPRAENFRDSSMARAFADGVRDPEALEAQGLAIIADCEEDRRNHGAVISYLQQKYNVELLQHMHVGQMTAWVEADAVPAPNPSPGADG